MTSRLKYQLALSDVSEGSSQLLGLAGKFYLKQCGEKMYMRIIPLLVSQLFGVYS